MKEIFKLSKREKKTVKKILQNELQRYYSDEEAEVLMNKVLDGRDKVQEALEAYEKAVDEYIRLEEKVGVVLRKRHFTPFQLSEYKLPDFVCLVGNEGETYLDLNYRLGVHGPKPEKDGVKSIENYEKYIGRPYNARAEKKEEIDLSADEILSYEQLREKFGNKPGIASKYYKFITGSITNEEFEKFLKV